MIYELRIYDVIPDKRAVLYERFTRHALALLKKHGFKIVDMWEPYDGREKLMYLLEWPDADTRERTWHAFRFDPEWIRVKSEAEKDGPLVTKMDYYLLHRAPFFKR